MTALIVGLSLLSLQQSGDLHAGSWLVAAGKGQRHLAYLAFEKGKQGL